MNSRNLEQVRVFRRYLMERGDQSRSRLMRAQIRRWVAEIDAAGFDRRGVDESASEEITRLKAA